MDKRELLLSIGFSKEYISYLDRLDHDEVSPTEVIFDTFQIQPNDVSNVIVTEARTNFTTKLIVQPK